MPTGTPKNGINKGWFKEGQKPIAGFKKGQKSWNAGKKAPQISKSKMGSKNPMWKGGIIYRLGYKFIKDRNHPFSNKRGYVRYSWLVMEKKIGRGLKKGEVVHHINGIKNDDRPDNLYLFKNTGIHTSYERNLKTTYQNW